MTGKRLWLMLLSAIIVSGAGPGGWSRPTPAVAQGDIADVGVFYQDAPDSRHALEEQRREPRWRARDLSPEERRERRERRQARRQAREQRESVALGREQGREPQTPGQGVSEEQRREPRWRARDLSPEERRERRERRQARRQAREQRESATLGQNESMPPMSPGATQQ